jgi:hypothetical protein
MTKGDVARFFEQWVELLEKDEEMKSRQKPWRTFAGGPTSYVGPGPYLPPVPTHDPSGWTKAKGYSKPALEGKELMELGVPEMFKYTFELKEGKYIVREGAATVRPVLRVEMPLDTFKDMVLTKQRVVWALADPRNKVECMWPEIGWSDWITVLEILVIGQELVEREPAMWDLIEAL